ncbi:MAG: APC family permease [Caldiserica bacterium]|nr:APC family permease [Caldisericota bacterium]
MEEKNHVNKTAKDLREEREKDPKYKEKMKGSGTLFARSLKLLYVYALATGAILTFMGYWDGMFLSAAGPSTFLAFLVLGLLMIPVGLVYAEFAALLPSAGVELVYGTVGINKHVGFWSTWLILAAWLAVPPAGMMGIIQWFNFIFNINLSLELIAIIAAAFITLYAVINLFEIKIAGQIQTFMLFFALGVCFITALMFFFSGKWDASNLSPFFSSLGLEEQWGKTWGIIIGWAMLITPFFGFETVPNLVEEGDFPIKDQTKAILGSILTCAAIYGIFFLSISGVAPNQVLTQGGSYPPFVSSEAIKMVFGTGIGAQIWLVVFGIGAVLFTIGTCILGFWVSSVRMLYCMARYNFLPKPFARVNRHHQPILPNLFIWVVSMVAMLLMNVTTFLQDFFCLMSFCCASAYALITLSSIFLAIKNKTWVRPYKIPGGMITRVFAFIISLAIAVFCAIGQPGWPEWFFYMGLGLALWLWNVLFKWPKEKVWMETPEGIKDF